MPDKSPAEQSAKQTQEKPQKDYSSAPQKPIKLKAEVTLPPALKGGKQKTKSAPPTPAKKNARKAATRPSTLVDEISPHAREIALEAAAREGVSLNAWLDALILQAHQSEPHLRSGEIRHIALTLESIERRLERLEDQRGFWSRFWDQFMEPPGRY